jgi:hypothetical protein
MVEVNQHSAECVVYTYKEGLLASVAHDLKLAVGRWSLAVTRAEGALKLDGRWEPGSIAVASVMRDGREAAGVLGQKDMDKIARTMREEVLHTDRHAEVRFSGEVVVQEDRRTAKVDGRLTLVGRTAPVRAQARLEGDKWVAEVALNQPDFGIKPYSAMLGALKIKPEVKVRVAIPVAALGGEV